MSSHPSQATPEESAACVRRRKRILVLELTVMMSALVELIEGEVEFVGDLVKEQATMML